VHERTLFGRAGEAAAERYLERHGLRLIERNYRCAHGEVDLVLKDDATVVFCEVKTRRTDQWGSPSEAVDRRKQRRLRRLAAQWLRDRTPGDVEVRFDVVSVIVRDGHELLVHLPDAF
jgi:putative endonuclease